MDIYTAVAIICIVICWNLVSFSTLFGHLIFSALVIGILLTWATLEKRSFSITPTKIYIENNKVTLHRFWKYAEFPIEDIMYIEPNSKMCVIEFDPKWTKVTVRINSWNKVFYIDQDIKLYPELICLLTNTGSPSNMEEINASAIESFAISKAQRSALNIKIVVSVFFACLGELVLWNNSPLIISSAFFVCLTAGALDIRSKPIKVEFNAATIVFYFLFRSQLIISESDIVAVNTNKSNSIIISLINGKKYFLSPYFDNYAQLVRKFQSISSKA